MTMHLTNVEVGLELELTSRSGLQSASPCMDCNTDAASMLHAVDCTLLWQ